VKKLLFLVAFVCFAYNAQAQLLSTSGVQHTIADAYLSAADSLHDFGLVNLLDCDSAQIYIYTSDSCTWAAVHSAVWGSASTDTAMSVGAERASVNAPGYQVVQWFQYKNKLNAWGGGAPAMRVYIRIYATGSEVASSGKKFRVWVKKFYHK
jgi:hypothetical protein